MLDNEMAIDLCENNLYSQTDLMLDRISNLIEHELHHMTLNAAFDNFKKNINPNSSLLKYEIIADLIGEGMATYYFTPWIFKEGMYANVWNDNMQNIDEKINNTILEINNIETNEQMEQLRIKLFDQNCLGYTIGFKMISDIKEAFGDEKIISLMNNFNLLELYNLTKMSQ